MVQTEKVVTKQDLGGPWFELPADTHAASPDSVASTMRFRARVTIEFPAPAPIWVHISADSRYKLHVNGAFVAAGPAKPSGRTWFADTVDVAALLVPGENIIGIDVLTYTTTSLGNASVQRTGRPGLLVRGTVGETDLSAPAAWRCCVVKGRQFHQGRNTLFLGIQETMDGAASEHDWLTSSFDDAAWQVPSLDNQEPFRATPRPPLAPRPIPQLTLAPMPLIGVPKTTDPGIDWSRLLGGGTIDIPPRSDISVDLDAGFLMTAFLAVAMEAGKGARLQLTAAECYEQPPTDIPWLRRKADRTDHVTGDLYGDPDQYLVSGTGTPEVAEVFSPFWFRTFRYVRLRITTADSPLRLQSVELTLTHYPLDITGTFSSSSDVHRQLWDVSVRTLLNCMHETFEDCPFYEQLQYAMDTRSQALFSLHLSADDRLIRRAIEDFAASGNPTGLTESRSPSVEPQFIPGFSLYWIRMIAEHVDYVGDRSFAERFIGRIDAVLGYFADRLAPDGFVISAEGDGILWNFVDWTEAWRASRGVPDLGPRRANTIATFMYVSALRAAASIADFCGRDGLAQEYTSRADALTETVRRGAAWDGDSGFYRDSDRGTPQSVHAQMWAVLSGVVQGGAATDLLRRAVADRQLAPCSYATALDLFDALRNAHAHETIDWTPWEDMLAQNLTTWAEDTVSLRSDCHAWGSVPLQHFPRYILGVSPAAPGFTSVAIDPAPSELDWAEGSVPTPHGPVGVAWKRTPSGKNVTVWVPAGLGVKLPAATSAISEHVTDDRRTLTFTL
ncbi:alpha-L-rhamnosidase C-terminal domain-containing protein [Arthrobacter sp. NPDC056493]|uniref:alpha-L-rhamnosidase-related protein n=1 Tax=Arthrobacter sp. NPDC056493 TaxID=3345839 RepID=UPI00366FA7ED